MSLFPNEDVLTKEIESWKGFADSLKSEKDRQLFNKTLNDCYKYDTANNAKGSVLTIRCQLLIAIDVVVVTITLIQIRKSKSMCMVILMCNYDSFIRTHFYDLFIQAMRI